MGQERRREQLEEEGRQVEGLHKAWRDLGMLRGKLNRRGENTDSGE